MRDRSPILMQRDGSRRDLTVRGYQMRAASADPAKRTVDAVLATENAVMVFDMRSWSMIREILVIAGRQFPAQVPLLDTHSRDSVSDQLGSTRNVRVEGNELVGTRHFSSVQEASDAFIKISEGHLTDGSIGYAVNGYRDLAPRESADINGRTFVNDSAETLRVTYDWSLMEDSVCPIGADASAKVRDAPPVNISTPSPNGASRANPTHHTPNTGKEDTMDFKAWLKARGLEHDTLTAAQVTALRADYDAEQTRAAAPIKPDHSALYLDLIEMGRSHGVELTRADLQGAKIASREAGLDMILVRSAEAKAAPPVATGVQSATVVRDAADKRHEAAVDGLLNIFGRAGEAKDLGMRRGRPSEVLRHFIGGDAFHLDIDELASIACRHDMGRLHLRDANQSAASFANVLANVADKLVMEGYKSIGTTHQLWTKERRVSDFKQITDAAVIAGLLQEQPAKGVPANEMKLGEKFFNASLGVFHCSATFSYQDWRNDDLGQWADTIADAGGLAARTEDQQAYKTLLAASWGSNTTSTAAVWDGSNQRAIFDKFDEVLSAVADRTATVNGEVIPLMAMVDCILAPTKRVSQLEVVAGIKPANFLPAQTARAGAIQVIGSPWLGNSSLSGFSVDDYFAIDRRLSPVAVLRDIVAPTPTVYEIGAGATPDRKFYIRHNFKAALRTLDGSQKGDWA